MPDREGGSLALVRRFEASMGDVFEFLNEHSDASVDDRLEVLRADLEKRWESNQAIPVERYLAAFPEIAGDVTLKQQLVTAEFQARLRKGESPSIAEYAERFPELEGTLNGQPDRTFVAPPVAGDAEILETVLPAQRQVAETAPQGGDTQPGVKAPRSPHRSAVAADDIAPTEIVTESVDDETVRVGRYRLDTLLGEGAFGRVWLAFDEELQRQIAIKVPAPSRFRSAEDAESYLAEARTVASLDHPHIVPVYDVGRDENGFIYVVSKFIQGGDLSERLQDSRPGFEESAQLVAKIALALDHAHGKQLIHRDVKPANILVEENTNHPYAADFGLAISEDDYLRDRRLAGTPAYMSPEQARNEGHRLDGRSDIFSLGVVLFELLTGKRPFRGSSIQETLHLVVTAEPIAPRDNDDSIPVELERICLKSLSKRASDRYSTAAQMADDLLHWNEGPQTGTKEAQIVPRGLRSFDSDDADFFLDLLPGPRDRDGLPESVRFWKTRIEESDPEKTFPVGLFYRLPTEAEWEYACRAGSITCRYFGETPQLIGEYAWCAPVSLERWTLPVASLKPNDLGLFDALGNVTEWSQDRAILFRNDRAWMPDKEVPGEISESQSHVLRGGSFISSAGTVRTSGRLSLRPGGRLYNAGFRVCRTLP